MKLGEAVYKQAQEEQAQPEQQGENTEENVVDADFIEVDPKEEVKK